MKKDGKVKFKRKALKDLDRRMQKIANGKAEFIPLKEVKKHRKLNNRPSYS